MATTPFTLRLAIEGRAVEVSGEVPSGPTRVPDVLPALQAVTNAVVRRAEERVVREGRAISCRAGCGACCRQMVPIGHAEARRLADLVRALPAAERARIEQRFAAAVATFAARGLLAAIRDIAAIPDPAERQRLGLEYFAAGVPCPFLDNESCGIHPDRPLSCREYLVTSPAANCAQPTAATIEKVEMPARLSPTLFQTADDGQPGPARWLPLVLALEWADAHAGEAPGAAPSGPALLQSLITRALA